ncbi:MAG TPA: hypothetical protein VMB79_16235 [Jatrophihabitans sp.]|nr:hypothetical protein [Jatrophihabitans sp.]
MAWLWWLLAPVASTVVGAVALALRASATSGSTGRDPIAEHRALLAALPQPKDGEPEPVTMLVIEPGCSPSAAG